MVVACVASSRFRGDLLRAEGTGGVGPFSFTGAAFIVVIGSLIAGMLIAAKDAAGLDDYKLQIARAEKELTEIKRDLGSCSTKYEHLLADCRQSDIPTVDEVDITVKTLTSEKNAAEPVSFEIEHDEAILARQQCGRGETWAKWDQREVRLPLNRAVLKDEHANLLIRVEKTPAGAGSGTEWGVQFTAVAKLSDGSELSLLRTPELVMGGHHDGRREFLPTEYERKQLVTSTRYPDVYLGHRRVGKGIIVDGQTYTPVRELAGAFGAHSVTPLLSEDKVVVAQQ
jgi:hypothetical protein